MVVGIAAMAAVSFATLAATGTAANSARPVNATPPTISGTAEEGRPLTAVRGTWNNSPTDYDYMWRRCASDGFSCANIDGATNLTYTPKSVDVGHTLRFRVVAKNADGQTTALSAPTAVVQQAPATTTTTTTAPRRSITGRRSGSWRCASSGSAYMSACASATTRTGGSASSSATPGEGSRHTSVVSGPSRRRAPARP